jgi:hypothetical protein
MTPTLENIWALALILFVCKMFADLYMSYFKWVQALATKRSLARPHDVERTIVDVGRNSNSPLCLAAACIIVVIISLLLKQDIRFPFLTIVNLAASTLVSFFGFFGDRSRASVMLP